MLGYVLYRREYSLREKDIPLYQKVYHSVRIYLCPNARTESMFSLLKAKIDLN